MLVAALALLIGAPAAAESLHAPVDVAARRALRGAAARPFACAAASQPVRDLDFEPFYSDSSFSVVDPVRYARYQELSQPIARFVREVIGMSDRWVRAQPADAAPARCALAWLDAWAAGGAMLGHATMQGGFDRKWALAGLALAWLELRQAPGLDPAATARVVRWFAALAAAMQPPYENLRSMTARNNHAYWAGLAAVAAAIATDDRALLDWGIARYRLGIAQIEPDGTLPLEMGRRSKALHYHLFSLAPLVMIAELAAANGIDLYAERDGALHRLARRTLDGLDDPAFFVARTGAAQDFTGGPLGRAHLAWIEPYFARFPATRRDDLLARFRPLAMSWLGGDTTLAYGAR
jgi:poly(beta-D-mannuronate) lyase